MDLYITDPTNENKMRGDNAMRCWDVFLAASNYLDVQNLCIGKHTYVHKLNGIEKQLFNSA